MSWERGVWNSTAAWGIGARRKKGAFRKKRRQFWKCQLMSWTAVSLPKSWLNSTKVWPTCVSPLTVSLREDSSCGATSGGRLLLLWNLRIAAGSLTNELGIWWRLYQKSKEKRGNILATQTSPLESETKVNKTSLPFCVGHYPQHAALGKKRGTKYSVLLTDCAMADKRHRILKLSFKKSDHN